MTRPSALKLVPLVLVILIAALPAGAGAKNIDRSFGNWTATFSGTFDYDWSEPDPEPCAPNGDGSVRARFSGRLDQFEISYLRKGAFSTFGLLNNTTRVSGSVTETDNRTFNPGPDRYGNPCQPQTIDKSGCGTRGYDNAMFALDSTNSAQGLFGPFTLRMTMDLGGTLNAFSGNPCYTGEGDLQDFGYFAGNDPVDSDTGRANWEYRLGKLVGPRLRVSMFEHRRPFVVTAEDTHRSTFAGPASYTGRRRVTVTFTPVANELRVEEQAAEAVTVPLPVRFRLVTIPRWATATSYEWQMKRSHSSRWTTVGRTATKTFIHTLQLAGHFKWRVIAYNLRAVGFRTIPIKYGRAEPLEVKFPTQDQLINDQTVRSFTLDAWLLTLGYATPQSRREVGYWIKLDTCSGTYGHTTRVEGPTRGPYDTDAEVTLGPRPADIPSNPPEVTGCATYMVASFHTHPPTTYQLPLGDTRLVGPSPADESLDRRDMVAGLVFDYIADPRGSRRIPYGHPKDKPAFLYRSGLVRRPTPP